MSATDYVADFVNALRAFRSAPTQDTGGRLVGACQHFVAAMLRGDIHSNVPVDIGTSTPRKR